MWATASSGLMCRIGASFRATRLPVAGFLAAILVVETVLFGAALPAADVLPTVFFGEAFAVTGFLPATFPVAARPVAGAFAAAFRSEERRVGKECRSRWSP